MIVPVAAQPHHRAHIQPVLDRLPYSARRTGPEDVALVPSYGDLVRARRAGFRRFALMQHGAGQSYGGDRRTALHPSYAGGSANDDVGLFLCPNEHSADRWRRAYPRASVAVVGCPRLDTLPARAATVDRTPIVAVSFHWEMAGAMPELRSGIGYYHTALPELAKRFTVLGHGHPKRRDLKRLYYSLGIKFVPDFDDVCRRADVYVCDNSSTLFEFASTGRPVVVLNIPDYRRDVSHGLRFWDAAGVGINVDQPDKLADSVAIALEDAAPMREVRESALSMVYAYRAGAAERAAAALAQWADVEMAA